MTPTRKATPFAVVYLIHCRRVRRRDLSANSERSPTLVRLPLKFLIKIPLNNYIFLHYLC
ncbi:MAG: hypothetical protein LBK82_01520 [Planctomycetaceae bacterium]|nr:hypothetical protein [Planctomycetaceae bacterium]